MTTKTQDGTPFSRLSRMGFSLFKSQPTSPHNRDSRAVVDDDESWYIPYNGPYEAPRRPPRHEKDRDSWGDPVVGEEDSADILGDPELRNRYGGQIDLEERKARARTRALSTASGRTGSSGAIDPGRNSATIPRRSTVSHTSRPVVPSFVDLDSAGGVGESPIPTTRYSKDTNSTKRKSNFTSLFTFNSGKRFTSSTKGLASSPTTPLNSSGNEEALERYRQPYAPPSIRHLPSDPIAAEQSLRSSGPDEQDYYNSYYSTLIRVPSEQDSDLNNDAKPSQLHSPASETSSAVHPYAYAITTPPTPPSLEPPHSAPLFPSSTARAANNLTRTSPLPVQIRHSPHVMLHSPTNHSLKNSVSTPNLRRSNQRSKPLFGKGKDRWLSPETWCDAILFPRPRFKIKQDSDSVSTGTGSGRIVSPPGSPVVNQFSSGPEVTSIASRVLAHSRSMADLQRPSSPIPGPSTLPASALSPNDRKQVPHHSKPTESRPPRPKSWALDDLVLPSPVPSLARVLEEGQILEHQRKKWQDQAIKSFQNERARSLSRARTKSLTSKQAKRSDHTSPLDFLAARGLLGNQDVIPVVQKKTRSRSNSHSQTESRGTVGKSSHTHTNSLSKSISKSSKTHSRNHSRSESSGRSAAKMMKTTAKSTVAMFGIDGFSASQSPEATADGLDGALQNNGTRFIRLADPALIPIEPASASRNGMSPTPSGQSHVSDSMMGIAISTPPPQEEIRLPSHPYAQGGLSFYNRTNDNSADHFAGPYPSSRLAVPDAHSRAYPLAQTITHPYAQYNSSAQDREESIHSFVADVRADSQVPPAEKMWTQFSPGLLREILPNELQYSPFISASSTPVSGTQAEKRVDQRGTRNSIFDTVGVAETLVSAMERYSRDSGLGTSEEQTMPVEQEAISAGNQGSSPEYGILPSQRPHRAAVQYDASRPLYIQKHNPTARQSPPIFESPERLKALRNDSQESKNSSSSSTSPPLSAPLGNVDDLDNYRDLFYRPSITRNDSNISATARVPWDVNPNGHSVGSGLTNIARQLTEELEETRGPASLQHSLSSRSSLSMLRQSTYSGGRSPVADSGLHFVFSNIPDTVSLAESTSVRKVAGDSVAAFKPSVQIPEDVESSRASSPTSLPMDNDELDLFRFGQVSSLATPPAVSGVSRTSYIGNLEFANEGEDILAETLHAQTPTSPLTGRQTSTSHSSLQPPLPSADPTRSSYLTTSDASRMSHLSDFPAPPPQQLTPAHMSLLSSYFDETLTPSEFAEVKATKQLKPGTRSRSGSVLTSRPGTATVDVDQSKRSTFGVNEDIDELLANLSSSNSRS